eukprot:scaffold261_cov170-Amphora_coffeaeformis.AAC.25
MDKRSVVYPLKSRSNGPVQRLRNGQFSHSNPCDDGPKEQIYQGRTFADRSLSMMMILHQQLSLTRPRTRVREQGGEQNGR